MDVHNNQAAAFSKDGVVGACLRPALPWLFEHRWLLATAYVVVLFQFLYCSVVELCCLNQKLQVRNCFYLSQLTSSEQLVQSYILKEMCFMHLCDTDVKKPGKVILKFPTLLLPRNIKAFLGDYRMKGDSDVSIHGPGEHD